MPHYVVLIRVSAKLKTTAFTQNVKDSTGKKKSGFVTVTTQLAPLTTTCSILYVGRTCTSFFSLNSFLRFHFLLVHFI